MANVDEQLKKVVDFAEDYIDATFDARELSEKCRDYYDGYQWSEAEIQKHKNRKQPTITNNRVKLKVQFLKGMETQNRADPKALPREPNDDKSGEVSTDALRFVEEWNGSDYEFSDGFQNYVVEGVEGHEVIADVSNGKTDVIHNRLDWDRLFWDPHSRRNDFSDARYLGTLQWMDEDEARDTFPDAPEEFFTFSESDIVDNDTFEDKPYYFRDEDQDRIRVFYCYYIDKGAWHYAIFSGGGFAQKPILSPYLNENDEPEPQFVFRSAFVDRHGNRYGEVASYLDIQDEINHRHSKMLHLLSVRQTWARKGAITDVHSMKQELSKPDGHVEYNQGRFGEDWGMFPTGDMANGQMLLLQDAKNNIDVVGANAVMEGQKGTSLSGRAVQSFQQAGVVELGSLFDGHKECRLRVYRMMFNRIKQFWTEEKWVRVLGNDENLRWTGLNRPITVGEKLEEELGEIPPQFEGDPRLDEIVDIENPVNELDVDIIMDAAADTLTLQHEQFELLANMYQANPQAVPFQLVIKASQLRNKDELIKMIEGGDDEQQAALIQAQQEAQQLAQELEQAKAQAQIAVDQSTALKNQAAANKMDQESKQIVVETAIDVQTATESTIA